MEIEIKGNQTQAEKTAYLYQMQKLAEHISNTGQGEPVKISVNLYPHISVIYSDGIEISFGSAALTKTDFMKGLKTND